MSARIKVISNPYKSEITYFEWDENAKSWIEINYDNRPDSKLISDKMSKSFLPFKVTEIVERIIGDYGSKNDSDPVEIIFEGNEDEYQEFNAVCLDSKYVGSIVLTKSERYIENAREILPEIIAVFDELKDLVSKSVRDEDKIVREIEKFKEASNKVIPICVLGNYSAGKSTFINALIGSEILPSSDQPTTARIFKINKSSHGRKAQVRFEYDNNEVCLEFYEEKYIGDDNFKDNALSRVIEEKVSEIEEKTLVRNVNKVLEILNNDSDETRLLSEIIEITVPFMAGILDQSPKDYVIFDTPGSNSDSNESHLVVLKKAMQNLSNGLPIYVSEFQALDTKDNAELYKVIESMKELDDRFTMIVVNKADQARLPKEGFDKGAEEKILAQAVPKKMFSDGMFFVSSIMALGSKNDGDFIDEYYSEVFETQKNNYTDEQSKFYKALYQYNITAEQIKKDQINDAATCTVPIYANSGLFSIEREIEIFADKYSSYNKCQQSRMFLDNIIKITGDEIEQTKQECEETKARLAEALEKERRELIERLDGKRSELETEYIQEHPDCRQDIFNNTEYIITVEELDAQKRQIEAGKAEANDYESHDKAAKEKRDAIGQDLAQNLKEVFKSRSVDSLKEHGKGLFGDLVSDFKDSEESRKRRNETAKEVEKATTDTLLEIVRNRFDSKVIEIKQFIDNGSRMYWTEKTQQIRENLVLIVTNSSALTEKEREDLSQIIMTYQNLEFETSGSIVFNKEKLVKGFRIGGLKIGAVDSLNTERIKKRYMQSIEESVDTLFSETKTSHEASFKTWLEHLMDKIKDNIVEFNPTLRSFNRIIAQTKDKIIELETRQEIIEQDKEKIRLMMEWKF